MTSPHRVVSFEAYQQKILENQIFFWLIDQLHCGVKMIQIPPINENMTQKAQMEIDRLLANSERDRETPIIKDFVPEVMALVKKFADSGQSGGSAPFTTGVIVKVIEKLLKQEPLGGVENTPDEWVDVSRISSMPDRSFYQSNRLFSVFKEGEDGKPYYIDAIVFRNPETGSTFTSGSVSLPGSARSGDGSKIGSSQYIRTFPFNPKTFVIDVHEKEYRKEKDGSFVEQKDGGWWESWVKDQKQLDEVWEYYDRKEVTD